MGYANMNHRYFFTCLFFLINAVLQGGRTITKEDIVNLQYVFSPALQNDKPVPVWMALPIRFRLVE